MFGHLGNNMKKNRRVPPSAELKVPSLFSRGWVRNDAVVLRHQCIATEGEDWPLLLALDNTLKRLQSYLI